MSYDTRYPMIKLFCNKRKGNVYTAQNDSRINGFPNTVIIKTFNKRTENYFIEDIEYIRKIPIELYVNNLIQDKTVCPIIFKTHDLQTEFVIVMEHLCDNWIELLYFIHVPRQENIIKEIMKNVVTTVVNLSKEGIYHLDIKPENIMVHQQTYEIKILDFEDALIDRINFLPKSNRRVGTEKYVAPEVLSGERYDVKKSMVYTLGCLLYTCIEMRKPDIIGKVKFRFQHSSKEAQQFINSCVQKWVRRRIEFDELLNQPYLK